MHQPGSAAVSVLVLVLAVVTIILEAEAVTHLKLVFASVLPGGSWFGWDDLSCSEELQHTRTHTHTMTARDRTAKVFPKCMCVRMCACDVTTGYPPFANNGGSLLSAIRLRSPYRPAARRRLLTDGAGFGEEAGLPAQTQSCHVMAEERATPSCRQGEQQEETGNQW